MRFISALLSIVLGAVFFLSGYLKLYPVEYFELSLIDSHIANWQTAPYLSRLIIGAEWLLGSFLVLNFRLKKITLPATLIFLSVFTLYLIFLLVTQGDKGDCGCFGMYLRMTPLQSIVKNGGLILLVLLLMKISSQISFRFQKELVGVLAGAALVLPFILNPPDSFSTYNFEPETVNFSLPKDLILEKNTYGIPSENLFEGKHIVCLMTLTCPHCRQAALKIHVIHQERPEISFFFFLNGKDEDLDDFFSATKSENIPHMKMSKEPFAKLTGGTWPQIWWVENGIVVKKSVYYTLNVDELVSWWNQP